MAIAGFFDLILNLRLVACKKIERITIPIIRAQFGHIADSIIIGMIPMSMIHFIFVAEK